MSKCSSQTKLPCKFYFSFLCLLGTSLICRGWMRLRELSADLSHTISSDNAVKFYGILCFGKQLAVCPHLKSAMGLSFDACLHEILLCGKMWCLTCTAHYGGSYIILPVTALHLYLDERIIFYHF